MDTIPNQNSKIIEVVRRVRQIAPSPNAQNETKPFEEFSDHRAIILLGQPGIGKTEVFRVSAEQEEFLTVRSFLRRSIDSIKGRKLFIDGLDEYRTEGGAKNTIDRLIERLIKLKKPYFRLSCRTEDWLGNSDLQAIKDVHGETPVVLQLLPLGEQEIVEVAQGVYENINGQEFYSEAMKRGLSDLLGNPQTLLMLLEVFAKGHWPDGRFDLYDQVCRLLVQEKNNEHQRSETCKIPDDNLLETAGAACAALLIANEQGIALSRPAASDIERFPYIDDFPANAKHLAVAARRRLFSSVGAERVIPQHRTVAEFLAARYLAERVRKGFPLNRVLALITGFDYWL